MDPIVSRPAGIDEPVEQRSALGIAHQTFFAHARILLAGRPHRSRHARRGGSRNAANAGRLCGFCHQRRRNSRDSGEKIRGRKVCRRSLHIRDRSDDGRRQSASIRHVALSGPEFCPSLRGQVPRPGRPATALLDNIVGLSTRVVGAIIMVHGDDQGLVLPPKLAPYQVVIVPIFKTDDEKKTVLDIAHKLKAELSKSNIRITLDEREGSSPGWKFNDWEMRGVPLRVELGPKDVAKQTAVLARRDRPGRDGKINASLAGLPATVERLLAEIQQSLHDKALAFRKTNTHDAKTYDELKKAVENGFAISYWCGNADCEAKIKEETRATMRCIPLEQEGGSGSCF